MEFFAFVIWFLLALAIPLTIIAISLFRYAQQVEITTVFFRLFIAIVAYIPVTFFALIIFGAAGNAIAHKKVPNSGLSLKETIFCYVMVFIYAVIGWLLCVFVNGGFFKPWLIFEKNHNEPQSILNGNDE